MATAAAAQAAAWAEEFGQGECWVAAAVVAVAVAVAGEVAGLGVFSAY